MSTSKDSIAKAVLLHRPQVLCLTETWGIHECPPEWQTHGYHTHWLDGDASTSRHRRGGGMLLMTQTPCKLVHKEKYDDLTMIVCQMGKTRIIGTYIRPGIGMIRFGRCLEIIHKWARGKCIAVGDWNARSRWWDTASNPAGNRLCTWAIRNNFTVSAPRQPTYRNNRGSSTVDLLLARGWYPTRTEILHGPWNDVSDHMMVKTKATCHGELSKDTRIPRKALQDERMCDIARKFYESAIPEITAQVENAMSPNELQTAMNELVTTLRKPWVHMTKRPPGRFRTGWTRSLDNQARKRSVLLRGNSADRERARKMDREIKRHFRANKRRISTQIALETNNGDLRSGLAALTKLQNHPKQNTNIDADVFTTFLAGKQTHDYQAGPIRFTVPPRFMGYISNALSSSKRGKAAEPDGIHNEMMQLVPKITTQTIMAIWRKVGRLGYLPVQFIEGTVLPLYKKGDADDPKNYRPIILLSHIRKVVTGALGLWLRDIYIPHHNQWGFCPNTNTEDAVLAASESITTGHNFLAILDLSAAYDSLRRDDLQSICTKVLPPEFCSMLPAVLHPQQVRTVGQRGTSQAKITMGVPQGDRSSPDLFNIAMDTLLNKYNNIPTSVSSHPVNAYADDVLLLAYSPDGLQTLVNIAVEWSAEHSLNWKVPKCSVIMPAHGTNKIHINSLALAQRPESEYLGMTISPLGVTDKRLEARIQEATITMHKIRQLTSLSWHARRTIVLSLVYSKIGYGLSTIKLSTNTRRAALKLDELALPWILRVGRPKRPSDLNRMRALIQIPSLDLRREQLLATRTRKLAQTLSPEHRKHVPLPTKLRRQTCIRRLQEKRNVSSQLLPLSGKELALREWNMANNTSRKIPSICSGPPPVISDQTVSDKARHISTLWFLHRFPRRTMTPPPQWLQKWRAAMETQAPITAARRQHIERLILEFERSQE